MGASSAATSISDVVDGVPIQLPVRFRPEPDELFSSWMVRAALANGLRVNQLARVLVGGHRHRQLFSGDPDRGIWHQPIDALAKLTDTDPVVAYKTCLRAYEGYLWSHRSNNGPWRHVLPLADGERKAAHCGIQYCPQCLAQDERPYFRRSWRLTFSVVCDWHRCELCDRCPHCGAAIRLHRVDVGVLRYEKTLSLCRCSHCQASLSDIKVVPASYELVNFQRLLLASLDRGWISIAGRCVHSVAFFEGLFILLSFLEDESQSGKLDSSYPLPSVPTAARRRRYGGVERCSWVRRKMVVERAAELLQNWPTCALEKLARAGVSSSHVFRYGRSGVAGIPFWLWQPIHEQLNRAMYVPTDEEVEHAARFLLQNFEEPTGSQLCKLLNMETRSSVRVSGLFKAIKKRAMLLDQ